MSDKSELLFYTAYEEFYSIAEKSEAFRGFCREAFGEDFSQDGFSNIEQIEMILKHIPKKEEVHILDIGCGNGKMAGYLQKRTGAHIYGFDYSEKEIQTAKTLFSDCAEFRVGVIGQVEYPEESFDVITSMDTMYFASDMSAFVSQIKRWLKSGGVFFVGYQEGDVMPKTEHADSTVLAKALAENGMAYEVKDITEQTYQLLKEKRAAAMSYKEQFIKEGQEMWYELLMEQTEIATQPFEEFQKEMARYIYVIRK